MHDISLFINTKGYVSGYIHRRVLLSDSKNNAWSAIIRSSFQPTPTSLPGILPYDALTSDTADTCTTAMSSSDNFSIGVEFRYNCLKLLRNPPCVRGSDAATFGHSQKQVFKFIASVLSWPKPFD